MFGPQCDNARWNMMFSGAGLVSGEMRKSDHRPLIVDTEASAALNSDVVLRPRRFEVRWLKEETVQEIVNSTWA